jgi:hypothetical protein
VIRLSSTEAGCCRDNECNGYFRRLTRLKSAVCFKYDPYSMHLALPSGGYFRSGFCSGLATCNTSRLRTSMARIFCRPRCEASQKIAGPKNDHASRKEPKRTVWPSHAPPVRFNNSPILFKIQR